MQDEGLMVERKGSCRVNPQTQTEVYRCRKQGKRKGVKVYSGEKAKKNGFSFAFRSLFLTFAQ
jgi:hypothetical protein